MSNGTENDSTQQSSDEFLDDKVSEMAGQAEATVSARDESLGPEEDSLTPESLEDELEGPPAASDETLHEAVLLDEVLADEDRVLEGFEEDEVEWAIEQRNTANPGGQS